MAVESAPVVWLCGAPGVGKSTVGWALYARWAQQGRTAGYVDIDQLAMSLPARDGASATTRMKADNLAAVLRHHRAAGAGPIVVSGVAMPTEVPVFTDDLSDQVVRWVALRAEREELHARFLGRAMPAELLPEVDRHARAVAASDFASLTLDTTGRIPTELAASIDGALPGRVGPVPGARRSGRSDPSGEQGDLAGAAHEPRVGLTGRRRTGRG